MGTTHSQAADETTFSGRVTHGLGELRIKHPPGTLAITPASLVSLDAVATHQHLLSGNGLDWGLGTGCLSIAAARIPAVEKVVGLELSEANVAVARENAAVNGVSDKTTFLVSDSYSPISANDRAVLEGFVGQTNFILANPPASEGDDGFGWRRRIVAGARGFLCTGGRLFLSVSSQYGPQRAEALCVDGSGFTYGGILATTDWVPFDLARADLLECLRLYAVEETCGGLEYTFHDPGGSGGETMNARAALDRYDQTGESPLMKWQTHLLEFDGA